MLARQLVPTEERGAVIHRGRIGVRVAVEDRYALDVGLRDFFIDEDVGTIVPAPIALPPVYPGAASLHAARSVDHQLHQGFFEHLLSVRLDQLVFDLGLHLSCRDRRVFVDLRLDSLADLVLAGSDEIRVRLTGDLHDLHQSLLLDLRLLHRVDIRDRRGRKGEEALTALEKKVDHAAVRRHDLGPSQTDIHTRAVGIELLKHVPLVHRVVLPKVTEPIIFDVGPRILELREHALQAGTKVRQRRGAFRVLLLLGRSGEVVHDLFVLVH